MCLFNIRNLKIASLSASMLLLYGCASIPTGTSKVTPLADQTRKSQKEDFQGLYTMWIEPQFVNVPGSGDRWGKIDVTDTGDQFASEKTISEGFAQFCSDMGGKSEIQPLKYGHKNVCTSAAGEYLGEFDTKRYESGLVVTFDSRDHRALQQSMHQAEAAAQNNREYQSLSSDTLSIQQLQSLIARFQNDDPENLMPHARARLAEMLDERNKEIEQTRALKRRNLENKHIGDQICLFDDSTSMNVPTGIYVFGEQQYRKVNGLTKVVGFVEDISGKKIKIRVSWIVFKSYTGMEQNLDSMTNYKGGTELKVDSIIWDSIYDWDGC